MGPTSGRDQEIAEETINLTLADSFPASDPPSWILGRDHNKEEKTPGAAITETSQDRTEKFTIKTIIDLRRNVAVL